MNVMIENEVDRVPVFNANNLIVAIISKSALIRFIARHSMILGSGAENTIEACMPMEHWEGIYSIPIHTKALEAFDLIESRRVKGVGIVNSENQLIHNLSTTDLKGLCDAHFLRLFLPVPDFLKETYADSQRILTPPLTCTPESSLRTVLLQLACSCLHRIYVIDGEGKPLGVVTCTDLINILHQLADDPNFEYMQSGKS